MSLINTTTTLLRFTDQLKRDLVRTFQDVDRGDHYHRWEHYLSWYALGGRVHTYVWDGWNNIIPNENEPISSGGIVHVDRYQTIDLVQSLDNILENLVDNDEGLALQYDLLEAAGVEDVYEELAKCDVMVKLREALMEEAISGVFYDW